MGFASRFLRVPRPQSFLYVMSLQTGASLITLSLLLNKISGLYGLLALLTGFHLSPFQLSMYIYSLLALGLVAILAPHIRKQSPLQCLALAWFYLFDSIINAAYTAAFAVTWFLVISQHHHSAPTSGPGSTMDDTAGFTNPKYNVTSVQLGNGAQDATHSTEPASAPAGTAGNGSTTSPSVGNGVLQPESIQSISIVCTLWTIRIYFVFIMLAFARQCLRQHAFYTRTPNTRYGSAFPPSHSRNPSVLSTLDGDPNPFAIGAPEGQGWKGKLGRIMVSVGRSYWIEGDDDFSWMTGMSRKFRRSNDPNSRNSNALSERERRRRSGTGPPVPSQSTIQAAVQGSHSRSSSQSQGHGQSVKMYELSEGSR